MFYILIYCLLAELICVANASITSAGLRSDSEILDEFRNSDKYIRGEDFYVKTRPSVFQRSGLEYFRNWPDNTIPFIISDNITQDLVAEIMGAIKFLNNYTCLNFRPLDLEKDLYWLRFLKTDEAGSPCSAEIGFDEKPDQIFEFVNPNYHNERPINITAPAVFIGDIGVCRAPKILHELLHVLGLFHEHQRNDRNNYIEVNWKLVEEGNSENEYLTESELCVKSGIPERHCTFNTYGVNYNYESIMHYCPTCGSNNPRFPAFSILIMEDVSFFNNYSNATNYIGKPTRVGQKYTLSEGDWLLINRKYGCDPDKNPQIRKPPQIPDNIKDFDLQDPQNSAIKPDYSGFDKKESLPERNGRNNLGLFYLHKK